MVDKIELTPGERLVLTRRRKSLSQPEAAKRRGVSLDRYGSWELDMETKDQPNVEIEDVQDFETCFIMRRRANMTQRELATKVNRSRLWVHQMERGKQPPEVLKQYWGV